MDKKWGRIRKRGGKMNTRKYRVCTINCDGKISVMSDWLPYRKAKSRLKHGYEFVSSIKSINELNWKYGGL